MRALGNQALRMRRYTPLLRLEGGRSRLEPCLNPTSLADLMLICFPLISRNPWEDTATLGVGAQDVLDRLGRTHVARLFELIQTPARMGTITMRNAHCHTGPPIIRREHKEQETIRANPR